MAPSATPVAFIYTFTIRTTARGAMRKRCLRHYDIEPIRRVADNDRKHAAAAPSSLIFAISLMPDFRYPADIVSLSIFTITSDEHHERLTRMFMPATRAPTPLSRRSCPTSPVADAIFARRAVFCHAFLTPFAGVVVCLRCLPIICYCRCF